MNKNSGEQEKESIYSYEGRIRNNLSLGITVCHHSASLVMPNDDPRDRSFFLTLTRMIDSNRTCPRSKGAKGLLYYIVKCNVPNISSVR